MSGRGAYFLHIPRTAGTTVRWILEGHYAARQCAYLYLHGPPGSGAHDYRTVVAKPGRDIACFSSHAHFGAFPDVQQRLSVVTMLRDPVARTVSHYHRLKEAWGADVRWSLEEYAERLRPMARDNLQVRTLSGLGSRGVADVAALDRARQHLRDGVAAFGVSERFSESMVLFARLFEWRDVVFVRQNVRSREQTSIDERTRARLAAVNELDSELYAYACQVWRQRLEQRPITEAELAQVREAHAVDRVRVYGQRLVRRLFRARVSCRRVDGTVT